jgi:2,5-diketo-D-gluconate reductase B
LCPPTEFSVRLRLTEQNMADIAVLDRGERLINPEGLAPAWD